MPYGMRGRLLWALPLLRQGREGARPGGSPALRRARARLKTRRAVASLYFDAAEAVLDEIERNRRWNFLTTRPGAAGAGPGGLREQVRSAVADRIVDAAEAWRSGGPARLASAGGLSQARGSALADYDV